MPAYILTGTPGSGKTAVLRLLETRGYPVVEEAATDVIALGQALGREEPWSDDGFIGEVLTLQRRRQDTARAESRPPRFHRMLLLSDVKRVPG
jgi:predicted ATPase